MTTGTETERRGFVHSALLYHSQREYLDFVGRFVADGMALGSRFWSRYQRTGWHYCAANWVLAVELRRSCA
ncbi:hypothetical protein NIIDMKKI_52830 [Mycobacterium kansasii]|uniref:Uncharacterized protein n=1 Tax=Mycobacterium kansasii TaxID=1768 RepID=A0A7G1IGW5_MYCKA|nr:hypothetical protein NIIDMKKI_52830 [Mycobacterium kansasii]